MLTDQFTRYPVTAEVETEAARYVLPKLDIIFAQFGIPSQIKTDNGPPFNGQEFAMFAQKYGFHHRRVTPLSPEANGDVEPFMKNVTKALTNAKIARRPWPEELLSFLRCYRATPHSSTKIAPATLLFGRHWQTKLPSSRPWQPPTDIYQRAIEND